MTNTETPAGEYADILTPRKDQRDVLPGRAASLSYDFNNLLLVVRSNATFLREELPAHDPRQSYVTDLLEATDRAARLTAQLATWR